MITMEYIFEDLIKLDNTISRILRNAFIVYFINTYTKNKFKKS